MTWPPNEQTAVEAYLMALWDAQLEEFPARHEIDTVLSSIAQAVDDMAMFLDAWSSAESPSAAKHFACFVWTHATEASLGRPLSSPWLIQRGQQERQVRAWLFDTARAFVPRMEAAFLEEDDESTLEATRARHPADDGVLGAPHGPSGGQPTPSRR